MGEEWRAMPEDAKAPYVAKAEAAEAQYVAKAEAAKAQYMNLSTSVESGASPTAEEGVPLPAHEPEPSPSETPLVASQDAFSREMQRMEEMVAEERDRPATQAGGSRQSASDQSTPRGST